MHLKIKKKLTNSLKLELLNYVFLLPIAAVIQTKLELLNYVFLLPIAAVIQTKLELLNYVFLLPIAAVIQTKLELLNYVFLLPIAAAIQTSNCRTLLDHKKNLPKRGWQVLVVGLSHSRQQEKSYRIT